MIIGISGKKQSGKDTVASMIQYIMLYRSYKRSYNFDEWKLFKAASTIPSYEQLGDFRYIKIIPFAYHLKKCASIILDCNEEDLYNESFKESEINWLGITVREFLQKLGTEVGRNIDSDLWVKAFDNQYHNAIKFDTFIVPDVRFVNEAEYIKNHNGILLRTNRGSSEDFHQSEIDLDKYKKFDFILDNNNSLNNLFKEVDKIVKQF